MITISKHRRHKGENVRVVRCDTPDEMRTVCSSNVTTQGTESPLTVVAWGNWDQFVKDITRFGSHQVERKDQ